MCVSKLIKIGDHLRFSSDCASPCYRFVCMLPSLIGRLIIHFPSASTSLFDSFTFLHQCLGCLRRRKKRRRCSHLGNEVDGSDWRCERQFCIISFEVRRFLFYYFLLWCFLTSSPTRQSCLSIHPSLR